jgi:hypothetical protein
VVLFTYITTGLSTFKLPTQINAITNTNILWAFLLLMLKKTNEPLTELSTRNIVILYTQGVHDIMLRKPVRCHELFRSVTISKPRLRLQYLPSPGFCPFHRLWSYWQVTHLHQLVSLPRNNNFIHEVTTTWRHSVVTRHFRYPRC